MPDFKEYIIGKSPNSDYQVSSDKTVSRVHAKIFVNEDGDVFITDLKSTNGTFVNGSKIPKGGGVKLNDYDFVKVGNSLVPWQDIVKNEGVSQEVLDEPELFEQTTFVKNNNNILLKLTFGFLATLTFLFAFFVLTSTDKNKFIGEWKTDSGAIYSFEKNGFVSYDSADVYKEGEWSIKKGNLPKEIELNFDSEELPIFTRVINTEHTAGTYFTNFNSNSYNGNIFNIKNEHDVPIKILGFSPKNLNNRGESVKTTIWVSPEPKSYDEMLDREMENGNLVYNTDHSNWIELGSDRVKSKEEVDVDIKISPDDQYSFLILSNSNIIFNESDKPVRVSLTSGNKINISTGQACYRSSRGKTRVHSIDGSSMSHNFLGSVKYGLMISKFQRTYSFYNNSNTMYLNNQKLSKL